MKRLLKWLLTGDSHLHKWEDYQKFERLIYYYGKTEPAAEKIIIISKCSVCGKFNRYEVGL